MGAGHLGQERPDLLGWKTGQAGDRGQRDVGSEMQAQQPEHLLRFDAELANGPGEHASYIGFGVGSGERVQAAPGVLELVGQRP
jgi:hypothetical protein